MTHLNTKCNYITWIVVKHMSSNDTKPIILYLKQNIIQYSFALKAKSSLRNLTMKFQCSYKRNKTENKSISATKENKRTFKITGTWDATPYSSVKVHECFGRKCCLQFMSQSTSKKQGVEFCQTTCCNVSEYSVHIHHFGILKSYTF